MSSSPARERPRAPFWFWSPVEWKGMNPRHPGTDPLPRQLPLFHWPSTPRPWDNSRTFGIDGRGPLSQIHKHLCGAFVSSDMKTRSRTRRLDKGTCWLCLSEDGEEGRSELTFSNHAQTLSPSPQARAFFLTRFLPSCFRSSSRSTWRIMLTSKPYHAHAMRCTP